MEGNKYTSQEGSTDKHKGKLYAAVAFNKRPTAKMPPTVWKRNGVVVGQDSGLDDIYSSDEPSEKKDGAWARLPVDNIKVIR